MERTMKSIKNRIVSPDKIVEEGVLNFCQRSSPVLMSPEGEVVFSGYQTLSAPSVLETSNVDEKTQIYPISDDEKLETLELIFQTLKVCKHREKVN